MLLIIFFPNLFKWAPISFYCLHVHEIVWSKECRPILKLISNFHTPSTIERMRRADAFTLLFL